MANTNEKCVVLRIRSLYCRGRLINLITTIVTSIIYFITLVVKLIRYEAPLVDSQEANLLRKSNFS